jgi:plastocyanin
MARSGRNWLRALPLAAFVAAFAATAGCAEWLSSTRSNTVIEITVGEATFTPAHVNVYEGTTIRWVNTSHVAHTITSAGDDVGAAFDDLVESGRSFDFTFHVAGNQRYFCRDHEGAGMAGVVTVVPAPPPIGDNAVGSWY